MPWVGSNRPNKDQFSAVQPFNADAVARADLYHATPSVNIFRGKSGRIRVVSGRTSDDILFVKDDYALYRYGLA
ncbi:MAG: hypothetical protein AMXMBFR84_27710 [Candidatus Hydrogenedentota bacterium]